VSLYSGVHDTITAKPIGCCIYCGVTDLLTDEHIIPYALRGRFVLPKSSCKSCATITSEFERRVLRGFMYESRVAAGFPTRRKKKRPKKMHLDVGRNGVRWQMNVPSTEYPAMMLLPLLSVPDIFVKTEPSKGVSFFGIQTIYFGKDPINAMTDLKVSDMRKKISNWDISAFVRLLAKIAYGYAVAELGLLPREEVPILPLILGKADDASYWLGSARYLLSVDFMNAEHSLSLVWIPDPSRYGAKLLLARVKLFASSGAEGYEIVVWQPKG
jgi:hypothetical protein